MVNIEIKPQTLGYGDYVLMKNELYIVAQTHVHHIGLICLSTGNRWRSPVRVEDTQNISTKEMESIAGHPIIKVNKVTIEVE